MSSPKYSLIWAIRESRSSNAKLLITITAIVMTLLVATKAFNFRVISSLSSTEGRIIGADRVIESNKEFDSSVLQLLDDYKVNYSYKKKVKTVLQNNGNISLVDIKAIDGNFPTTGRMLVSDKNGNELAVIGAPRKGSIWLDQHALDSLDINVGDSITVNDREYIVAKRLLLFAEPVNLASLSPKVVINIEDLQDMGLVGKGARLEHHLLYSTNKEQLAHLDKIMEAKYKFKINKAENNTSFANRMIYNASQWNGLAFIVQLIVGLIALNYGLKHFFVSNRRSASILSALGCTRKALRVHYTFLALVITFIAALIGAAIGLALDYVLGSAIMPHGSQSYFPYMDIIITTVVIGAYILIGIWPLTKLKAQEFRASVHKKSHSMSLWAATIATVVIASRYWVQLDSKIFTILLTGIVAAMCVYVITYLVNSNLHIVIKTKIWSINFALKEISRFSGEYSLIMSIFIIIVASTSALYYVNNSLLANWQSVLDSKLPNYFVIDIPDESKVEFADWFAENGLQKPILYPLLVAPITKINGYSVDKMDIPGKKGFYRPLRLSAFGFLKPDNKVIEGLWFGKNAQEEISVEHKFAKKLGLKLGDSLSFQAGDRELTGRITSTRKVNWDSMTPNFFVILSPGSFGDVPYSYMTSFYIPKKMQTKIIELNERFPEITMWDINMMMRALALLLRSLSVMFYVVNSIMILLLVFTGISIFACHFKEHEKDWSLLKALGASKNKIARYLSVEFTYIAFISGTCSVLLGTLGADRLLSKFFAVSRVSFLYHNITMVLSGTLLAVIFGILLSKIIISRSDVLHLRNG